MTTETKEAGGIISYNVRFRVDPRDDVTLADGRRALFDALITYPPQWAGQVRDIIIAADGGIHLGPDLNPIRTMMRAADLPPLPSPGAS